MKQRKARAAMRTGGRRVWAAGREAPARPAAFPRRMPGRRPGAPTANQGQLRLIGHRACRLARHHHQVPRSQAERGLPGSCQVRGDATLVCVARVLPKWNVYMGNGRFVCAVMPLMFALSTCLWNRAFITWYSWFCCVLILPMCCFAVLLKSGMYMP